MWFKMSRSKSDLPLKISAGEDPTLGPVRNFRLISEVRMKKINKLIEEIGLRPEASPRVKKALIKYLIQNSVGASPRTPTSAKPKVHPQQLSFEFSQDQSQKKEKVS
jgi:hypothetical protein